MMASITIRRTWEVNGAMADPTSVMLRDEDNVFGVKRSDTGEVVIPSGVAYDRLSAGVYEKEVTGLAVGVIYVAATEIVYAGLTYRYETTHVANDDTSIVSDSEVLADLGISIPTAVETDIVTNAIRKAQGAVRSYLGYDPAWAERTEYHPQQPFQAQISRGIWEVMEQRAVLRQVSESATNELQLRHLPVRSITSLKVDYNGRSGMATGAFGTETLRTEGSDFWANYDCFDGGGSKVCMDGIVRALGLWPTTPGTVKIVYVAGYTSSELRGSDSILNAEPIWEATLDEASRRVRKVVALSKGMLGLPAGLKSSEGMGDYNYSMDARSLERLLAGGLASDNKELLQPFVNWGYALGS